MLSSFCTQIVVKVPMEKKQNIKKGETEISPHSDLQAPPTAYSSRGLVS
jgi:hypothetical protein